MGLDKQQRPAFSQPGHRLGGVVSSTAASTALEPRGVISLATTSTANVVNYTFSRAPKTGDEVFLHAAAVPVSTAVIAINMGTGVVVGTSSQDRIQFSASGEGAHLIAISTGRWAPVGINGAAFATST